MLSANFIFFKSIFSKNSFRNPIRVPNSWDPAQARRFFVGPDLSPNCLQRLGNQQTTKTPLVRKVKKWNKCMSHCNLGRKGSRVENLTET